MIEIPVLYLGLSALMLVTAASLFLLGAVKDYQDEVVGREQSKIVTTEQAKITTVEVVANKSEVQSTAEITQPSKKPVQQERQAITDKDNTNATGAEETPLKPIEGEILVAYGWREHPVYKDWRFHPGINIRAEKGTRVKSAKSGKVTAVERNDGMTVHITHPNGAVYRYGNLQEASVEVGQFVRQGQKIGSVGSSVFESGTYLHFEIWKDDRSIDPVKVIEW